MGASFSTPAMKKEFIEYANSSEFPDTVPKWHEYDPETRQVFLWVFGEWNMDIKEDFEDFVKQYDKKILIGTMMLNNQTGDSYEDID
ncbi:MAG TPA: hypothetical protein EYG51_26045 [Pseudomonadales bacterium]|nr:hypothetical protein [Pseudomonadales bacterium]